MHENGASLPMIPPRLGQWINQQLPPEALWEVRPVDASNPPYRVIAYDVIITGDRPPTAVRACTLETACRRAVRRYLRSRGESSPKNRTTEAAHGVA